MFYLIGIGLKPEQISVEALHAIKKCRHVFIETYTSSFSEGNLKQLEKIIGKKSIELGRIGVEQQFNQLVEKAKKSNCALLVIGNPLTASTHSSLLEEMRQSNVEVKVVAGISIVNFLPFTGLSSYKFGRISSIVFHEKNYSPTSFYNIIEKNSENELHTLCLLDIKKDLNKFMSIKEALQILLQIAKQKNSTLLNKAMFIGIARASACDMKIVSGNFDKLIKANFGKTPHSLIVCAKLDFNEEENVRALTKNKK
ncbi:MAG: diphthine synthase [archaeon]|nr:diphthine synthase [archaeon]